MDLARGLKKIVKMYGERILAATGGWVDWENPLGCGHYGCVWELWSQDPNYDEVPNLARPTGRVLKISVDPTEGPVVAAIMKTGQDKRLDGLVRWEGVWRIPSYIGSAAGRDKGWVIIREEVKPFNSFRSGHFRSSGDIYPWLRYLDKYNASIRRFLDLKTQALKNQEFAAAEEALKALSRFEETYYVSHAIYALILEGITLADIHEANLGGRVNPTEEQPVLEARWADQSERPPLLIYDPGHSEAPPTEVPDLW